MLLVQLDVLAWMVLLVRLVRQALLVQLGQLAPRVLKVTLVLPASLALLDLLEQLDHKELREKQAPRA